MGKIEEAKEYAKMAADYHTCQNEMTKFLLEGEEAVCLLSEKSREPV